MVFAIDLYDNSGCGEFLPPSKSNRLGVKHGRFAKIDYFRCLSFCCWWRWLVYFHSALIRMLPPGISPSVDGCH
jgi:hypothetical protein